METVTVISASTGNPQIRKYTVLGPRICDASIVRLHRKRVIAPESYDETMLAKAGRLGALIAERLTRVRGVTDIHMTPNEVSVTKTPLYDWDEVERGVLDTIQRAFNLPQVEVERRGTPPLREDWLPDRSPRMLIEEAPNPVVRKFYLNSEISHYPIHHFYVPVSSGDYGFDELGETGQALLSVASDINGIKEIFLCSYSLHVQIVEGFPWPAIEQAVIAACERVLAVEQFQIERKQAPFLSASRFGGRL